MQGIESWLFMGTPPATVLRKRPMSITLFEKHGMDPWDPNFSTISELCSSRNLSMAAFFAEMKSLPEPGADTDWKYRPICELLDFLTREHIQFQNGLVPEIGKTLYVKPAGEAESLLRLHRLAEEWPKFSASLIEHMQEEEIFLFPKILQYDYCLRHNGHHPDFSGGTVNVFVALRMLGNEKQQLAGVGRFLNEVLFSRAAGDRPDSLESRLEPLLEEFQTRLLTHSGIETNILFPMAKAVEKAMMDKWISGDSDWRSRPQVSILK
jgi:regulator of cell morphogenesis and NO signaling